MVLGLSPSDKVTAPLFLTLTVRELYKPWRVPPEWMRGCFISYK